MVAKILIIDDQPDLGRAIARMLRGYETTIETDPRRALHRIVDGDLFDVILCDLAMPEMDGREVYEELRKLQHVPPVVMMSGYDDAAALVPAGCLMLLKPFRAAELRAILSTILSNASSSTEPERPRAASAA